MQRSIQDKMPIVSNAICCYNVGFHGKSHSKEKKLVDEKVDKYKIDHMEEFGTPFFYEGGECLHVPPFPTA